MTIPKMMRMDAESDVGITTCQLNTLEYTYIASIIHQSFINYSDIE